MSQISPPVRILLVGAVLFLAAWFTVLRPKADAGVTPAATPVATVTPSDAFGRAAAKARGAVTQANAASERAGGEASAQATTQTQAQTGSAKTAPAQPAVAIPAKVLATLPKDVAGALKAHKTLVLGVIADRATDLRPLADDDRYVRNALRKVNRYDGQVLVKRVPAGSLVRYAPLVGDLHVGQTPSIVVVDGNLTGTVLPGYVDRISINQAIADARRNSIHPLITDRYLRRLNSVCAQYFTSFDRWSWPTIAGKPALRSSLGRRVELAATYRAKVAGIAAPARWASLKRQIVSRLSDVHRTLAGQRGAILHRDLTKFVAVTNAYDFSADRKLDGRLDRLGVTSCVGNRRS